MKLKKLTLHNIASIEDAVIDFAEGPLARCDVFLITGETGAGKSTILDAICLALYDNTPRFENNLAEGNSETDEDLRLDNPRQILRRNTGIGWVKLEFDGNNGRGYEATWTVRRAHDKPTGALQPRRWELKRLDDKTEFIRKADIQNEIATAVGLDFTQFCRTSMLAQGEFAKFLNSRDNDKAAILERITGTGIYSRIGRRIHEIFTEKGRLYTESRSKIDGIEVLGEERLKEIADTLEALHVEDTETIGALDAFQAKRDWLANLDALQKTLAASADRERLATQTAESDDIVRARRTEADWHATADARNYLADIDDESRKLASLDAQLAAIRRDFDTFRGGILFEKQRLDEVESRLAELTRYFADLEPRRPSIEGRAAIAVHLNALMQGRKTIAEQQEKIETEQTKLAALNVEKQKVDEARESIIADINALTTAIDAEEKALEAVGLPTLRRQKETLTQCIADLRLVQSELKNFLERSETFAQRSGDLEAKKASLAAFPQKIKELKEAVDAASVEEAKSKAVYDSQKDTVDAFAKALRHNLHPGDDCPVCRQKILQPFMSEDELDALILSYKTAWESARTTLDGRKDLLNRTRAERDAANDTVESLAKDLAREKAALDAKQLEISAKISAFGLAGLTGDTLGALDAVKLKADADIAALDLSIARGEDIEAKLNASKSRLFALQNKLNDADGMIQDFKERIARCDADIRLFRTTATDRAAENARCELELSRLVAGEWQADWRENPAAFKSELDAVVEKYAENQRLQSELEKAYADINLIYRDALADRDIMVAKSPEWADGQDSIAARRLDGIVDYGNDLIARQSATLNGIADALGRRDDAARAVNDFLAEGTFTRERLVFLAGLSPDYINMLSDDVKAADAELLKARTSLEEARARMSEHEARKPAFDDGESAETILQAIETLNDRRKAVNERIGALNRDLEENRRNEARIIDLRRDADLKKADLDRWQALKGYLGNPDGSLFRKIAQSYVLGDLIRSANHYMNTLSGRYRLRNAPGSFVIMVDDAYQGGAARAATTLSGGETFLVSLSLALALSDLGDRIGVDTLFIDEGFGTLSGEPLQNAVDTLRALHTRTGRHVGIISHIEELREQIPVQIAVEQDGNSAKSRITVIDPLASPS